MNRKEPCLNIDSRSGETLSYKQSIAFVAIECHYRCVFWNVSPIEPVDRQLVLGRRRFDLAHAHAILCQTGMNEQCKNNETTLVAQSSKGPPIRPCRIARNPFAERGVGLSSTKYD